MTSSSSLGSVLVGRPGGVCLQGGLGGGAPCMGAAGTQTGVRVRQRGWHHYHSNVGHHQRQDPGGGHGGADNGSKGLWESPQPVALAALGLGRLQGEPGGQRAQRLWQAGPTSISAARVERKNRVFRMWRRKEPGEHDDSFQPGDGSAAHNRGDRAERLARTTQRFCFGTI